MTTIDKVIQWALDKDLIHESNSFQQFAKVVEETGEIASALCKKLPKTFLADAIGDTVVTLIILAAQNGLDLMECLDKAYDEIKNRKGKTKDGVFIKSEQ